MQQLLTPSQLSDGPLQGLVKVTTLAMWRHRGRGPQFLKIGGRVAYAMEDVNRWLREARRDRTGPFGGSAE